MGFRLSQRPLGFGRCGVITGCQRVCERLFGDRRLLLCRCDSVCDNAQV